MASAAPVAAIGLFAVDGADEVELADFDGRRPHPLAAPEWAMQPLA